MNTLKLAVIVPFDLQCSGVEPNTAKHVHILSDYTDHGNVLE